MTFSKQCYLKIYAANTHAEREKQSQVKMKVDFYVDNSIVKRERFKRFKVRDKLKVRLKPNAQRPTRKLKDDFSTCVAFI
jgi:hypothetical protein